MRLTKLYELAQDQRDLLAQEIIYDLLPRWRDLDIGSLGVFASIRILHLLNPTQAQAFLDRFDNDDTLDDDDTYDAFEREIKDALRKAIS